MNNIVDEFKFVKCMRCDGCLTREIVTQCLDKIELEKKCLDICCSCLKGIPKYTIACGKHKKCQDCRDEEAMICLICKAFS